MQLRTIVAATDESETGRDAARAAFSLGERSGARIVVMTVLSPSDAAPALVEAPLTGSGVGSPDERLARSFQAELPAPGAGPVIEFCATSGVPGIEIPRFAESRNADLLVLGRTRRSQARRLLLGDTADAVARRSAIPCLFVGRPLPHLSRVVVALDGTERGVTVLTAASDFVRAIGARMRAVTVEPRREQEAAPGSGYLLDGRSTKLALTIDRLRIEDPDVWSGWEAPGASAAGGLLRIRHGDPVSEVLTELGACGADLLVIGYHRGGPPGVLEGGSVARRLAHDARCAVLTVPL
jgi:nucleotide-binding universal stress UspA family protein